MKCLPPRRNCGEKRIPSSIVERETGPPFAETRLKPSRNPGKITTSSTFHAAPPNVDTSCAITCVRPLETRIFFSVFAAKNPTHSLSGDQKGVLAPSVPGRAFCSSEYRERTQSFFVPFAAAPTYAICRPSGDNANGTSKPDRDIPSAGDTES